MASKTLTRTARTTTSFGSASHSIPRNLQACLLIFIFSLPLIATETGVLPGGITLPKLTGIIFFLACLLYANKFLSNPPHALWWFLGYLAIFILNGLYAPDIFRTEFLAKFFTLSQLIVTLWLCTSLCINNTIIKSVLLSFSISCFIVAIGGLLHLPGFNVAEDVGHAGSRLMVGDKNPNHLGFIMALAVVIFIGFRIQLNDVPPWQKRLFLIMAVPPLLLMIATGSRAALLALLVAVSLYACADRKARRKLPQMIASVLVLIPIILILPTSSTLSTRWAETFDESRDESRAGIWTEAPAMISERPLLGWKPVVAFYELGKRENVYDGLWTLGGAKEAHNLLLHLLLEGGIIGTLPFLGGLFICAILAWRARKGSLGIMPIALLATLLTFDMAHNEVNQKEFWVILAISISSGTIVQNQERMRRSARYHLRGFHKT